MDENEGNKDPMRSCFNYLSCTSILYKVRVGIICYWTVERASKFTDWSQIKM